MSKNRRNDDEAIQALWTIVQYCKAGTCAGCVFDGNCPHIDFKAPSNWERINVIPTPKPENNPIEEEKTEKGTTSQIEELERQIDCIYSCLDSHVDCIRDLRQSCDDLEARIDKLEKWRRG